MTHFAVALIFTPVLTLSGIAGRLFAPLGIAYILSILASLVVALTLTPALSMLIFGKHLPRADEPPTVRWLKKRYVSILERIEQMPGLIIGSVAVITLCGIAAIPFFATSFLPELHEGHYILHMIAVPGTSIEESLQTGREVTAALLKLPFVRTVARRVGRAELADDTWDRTTANLRSTSSRWVVNRKRLPRESCERP
jgi:Cu/Ag efflux pump CusA